MAVYEVLSVLMTAVKSWKALRTIWKTDFKNGGLRLGNLTLRDVVLREGQ